MVGNVPTNHWNKLSISIVFFWQRLILNIIFACVCKLIWKSKTNKFEFTIYTILTVSCTMCLSSNFKPTIIPITWVPTLINRWLMDRFRSIENSYLGQICLFGWENGWRNRWINGGAIQWFCPEKKFLRNSSNRWLTNQMIQFGNFSFFHSIFI
jgi:hypothetical protein